MNIEEQQFDPAPGAPPPHYPGRNSNAISPFAYGWIAGTAIILCYFIGSSLIVALFADGKLDGEIVISTPNLFFASIIGQSFFLLLPTLLLAAKGPSPMRETLRLRRASVSFFLLAGLGVLACRILGGVWLIVQEIYLVPDSMLEWYRAAQEGSQWLNTHLLFGPNIPLLLLALFAVAVVPAVSEEMVFRGIFQRSFEGRLQPTTAILLAAGIFGAIHQQPINFIPLAGVGAFLGLVAWTSRSIWPAVFGHFLFNGIQIVLLNISGISFDQVERTPTQAGLYALLPVTLLSLFGLISIVRALRQMQSAQPQSPLLSVDP